jgi:N-methylhydantoinase B
MEMEAPIRVHRLALSRDSGGAGRQRGGLGIIKEFETLVDAVTITHRGERHYHPASGSHGGLAGAKSHSILRRAGGGEEVIASKMVGTMNRGDRMVVTTAGGGGYGDPHLRDRAAVADDVRNGKVSAEAARAIYGLAAD